MAGVALLHPGAMGARVGGELVTAGHDVRWLPAGRSAATVGRAQREGLRAAPDEDRLLAGADVVVSVLPPQFAVQVARLVASAGFTGTYVEANPVSPATLAEVRQGVEAVGATLVDGGIVGPPPRHGHRTHLYLAGPRRGVSVVEALFTATRVTPVVLGETVGQASAAKQAYSLFNKGRMVLAAAAAGLADAHGVRHVLAGESGRPGADLLGELDEVLEGIAEVAWRWGPEMDDVADALEAVGAGASTVRGLAADLRRTDGAPGLGTPSARG